MVNNVKIIIGWFTWVFRKTKRYIFLYDLSKISLWKSKSNFECKLWEAHFKMFELLFECY